MGVHHVLLFFLKLQDLPEARFDALQQIFLKCGNFLDGRVAALFEEPLVVNRPNLVPGASNNPSQGTSAGCTILANGTVTPPIAAGTTPPANSRTIAAGTPLATPDLYLDPCAFSFSDPQFFGNIGRNTVIGPGLATVDFSLVKNFPIREKARMQFRGEFFNILNRANFTNPSLSVFDSRGRASGTVGRINSTSTSARQIQFGLKISF